MALIEAPPTAMVRVGRICGKERYSLPQIIIARFCSSIDTPIAVISGASLGALRSGR